MSQRVVEQDAQHPGDVAGIAQRPGVVLLGQLEPAIDESHLELGDHRAQDLAEVDRLAAHGHAGVDPAQVEQLARQLGEANGLLL